MDDKLIATIGVRAPFFKRELNQYCYSLDATTNVLCTTQNPTTTLANGNVTFGASTRQYIKPFSATAKFEEILPNVGLSYAIADKQTIYASYAGGLSAPRTDNLYAVRRLADGSLARANPDPEQTDSIDLGWRYSSENLIASAAIWQSQYKNRIVSSFDPDLGFFIDRNVGDVDLQGLDLQAGWRVNDWMTVSANASYNDSELKNDLRASATATLPTKGKQFVETPEYTYGGRVDLTPIPNLSVGFEGKFVDERYTTDINDAKVGSYTLFHFNAGYEFDVARLKGLRAQLVVYNLFDEEFFGNISSTTNAITTAGVTGSTPNLSLGAPRSMSLTIQARF
jgi:iron complex outermembrane receptor protein